MCEFELPDVSLRCFVARQLLLRIYALSSVKFQASNCGCVKKVTNMMYGSSHLRVGHLWRCCEVLRVATIHGHRAGDVNHGKWSHNVSSSHLYSWSLLAGGDINQHGKW